jgi:hypothetical protein
MKFLTKIWREIRDIRFTVFRVFLPTLYALTSGRQLKRRTADIRKLGGSALVAVVPFYGDARLLPTFLDYHRKLGIDAFVMLDLSKAGDLAVLLNGATDCVVWRPKGGFRLERALLWLNYLRRRYATGRWCLSIEPSEFIVFHRCETRKLKDLIEFVASERRNHVFGIVVEMYNERPASELSIQPGEDPRKILNLFDPLGYETAKPGRLMEIPVRGGPQRRLLFRSNPRRAPALNRVPLVKWSWFFNYGGGTRVMTPRKLNQPHALLHSSLTVCLLNYAQLFDEAELSRAAQAERRTTIGGTGDPIYPGIHKLRRLKLKTDVSEVFRTSQDLDDAGLFNPGQWF